MLVAGVVPMRLVVAVRAVEASFLRVSWTGHFTLAGVSLSRVVVAGVFIPRVAVVVVSLGGQPGRRIVGRVTVGECVIQMVLIHRMNPFVEQAPPPFFLAFLRIP
jgi:hypothetical protein